MYDHIHLLIKPGKEFNYSECIHCIKRHFSRDINIILNMIDDEGEDRDPRLPVGRNKINKLILNNKTKLSHYPKFQWQKSFHDHIIRNQKDFDQKYNYIANNHYRHSAEYNYPYDWKYVYPSEFNEENKEIIADYY